MPDIKDVLKGFNGKADWFNKPHSGFHPAQLFFHHFLLPHLPDKSEPAQFHTDLFHALDHSRAIIAAPRAHAKSTIFSFAVPLWAAYTGSKREVIITSATAKLAEKWLARIRDTVHDNDALAEVFGDQTGKPWRNDEVKFHSGTTIYAKGRGFQIRGFRPDLVILDDLETDEIVDSESRLEKLHGWLMGALVNTLDAGANNQLIYIGNMIGPGCILKELLDRIEANDLSWFGKTYKSITDKGIVLWPEKWSEDSLDARRQEIGDIKFESEFQNNPTPVGLVTFHESWIQYYRTPPKILNKVIVCDMADSLKRRTAKTGIVVMGMDEEENRYIIEFYNERFLPEEFYDLFFKLYERHKPDTMAVEHKSVKNHMRWYINQEQERRGVNFPVRFLTPTAMSKESTIEKSTFATNFQRGKIFFREDQKELIQQILQFPYGRYKDLVDACVWCDKILYPPIKKETPKEYHPNSIYSLLKERKIKRSFKNVVF